ncbi:MAG: lipoprotein, partial [Bacteroidales bacterium]|nr:lipoprotein [Bacteroidales bacterium]
MKKILLFAAAVLALAACSKESPVKEEGIIDASKIVFKI